MPAPRLFLIPAQGRQVRIPETNAHLPAAGMYVDESAYWRRRVQTGDVLRGTPGEMAQAYATVDAVAALADKALADAQAAGTPDAADKALQAFEAAAAPLADVGRDLSAALDSRDAAQVDAYAAIKINAPRAKLADLATGKKGKGK